VVREKKLRRVVEVVCGDSTLAVQQRVEDAGFPNVIVMPMGGDKVLITCNGGEDFWKVFHGAIDFFGLLFSNYQRWMSKEFWYERGAWSRAYGVPFMHGTMLFFSNYVSWKLGDLFMLMNARWSRLV